MESMGWPLPNIKDMLRRIGEKQAKWFGVIDLTSGYHQIDLYGRCRKYAAFRTAKGTFEPIRIPFGIKVALAYFQRKMQEVY